MSSSLTPPLAVFRPSTRACPYEFIPFFDTLVRPRVHDPLRLFSGYVRRGMRVLDIGCGRGLSTVGLARLVGPSGGVVASDTSTDMLAAVRARAEASGVAGRVLLHRSPGSRTGLSDRFDFALAFWMVHEVEDKKQFLDDLRRRLKSGRYLFLVEPRFHVNSYEFDHIVALARCAGFRLRTLPRVAFSRAAVLAA
jgi:ubiquinone/menaquinone biosynthesis C-methylase UbiE